MQIGLDHQTWRIGSQFKGVKCIPGGPHFLHFRVPGEDPSIAPKVCRFLWLAKGQIAVFQWNQERSDFFQVEGEDADCYAEGVRALEFFPNLGPYPLDSAKQWARIAYLLSEPLLRKICPA